MDEIRKRPRSCSGFSRRSLTILLGARGTRRAQTRSFEGTLRFPQRGKLARLEAPLPFSLRSRNHARSASSHGLLHDLVLALSSRFPRRGTDLFLRTGRSGVPRGYAPLVAGRKSEKGRQGAKRTLEGVFPSKEIRGRLNFQWSLQPFPDLSATACSRVERQSGRCPHAERPSANTGGAPLYPPGSSLKSR